MRLVEALSHAIHSLSYASEREARRAADTGALHASPSGERLIPSSVKSLPRTSVEMSHVPCAASYATAGSLARGASPGGLDALVRAGRMPDRHVRPASVDVAQPIPAAPPSLKRPTWKLATAVELQPATLGSTSVWCWPGALVSVSTEIRLEMNSQSRAIWSTGSAVTASMPLPQLTRSVAPNRTSIRSAFAVPLSRSGRGVPAIPAVAPTAGATRQSTSNVKAGDARTGSPYRRRYDLQPWRRGAVDGSVRRFPRATASR